MTLYIAVLALTCWRYEPLLDREFTPDHNKVAAVWDRYTREVHWVPMQRPQHDKLTWANERDEQVERAQLQRREATEAESKAERARYDALSESEKFNEAAKSLGLTPAMINNAKAPAR